MTLAINGEVKRAGADATPVKPLSDELGLVARAKAGNESAFGELVRRCERRIFGIAHRITRNHEDAEDVVQQAFHRAFLFLNRFLGDSTFCTWLTRIAINEALMTLRRRRHNIVPFGELADSESDAGPAELPDSQPTPEQQYAQFELRSALIDSVMQLRPRLRVVILLREMRDFSTTETAELLGISVSAVKTRLFQARSKLRKTLDRSSLSGTREAANQISSTRAQTAQR